MGPETGEVARGSATRRLGSFGYHGGLGLGFCLLRGVGELLCSGFGFGAVAARGLAT